jgi:aminopeptidase N
MKFLEVQRQVVSVDIDLENQVVRGDTTIKVLQRHDDQKTLIRQNEICLHARQFEIESVTVNGQPAKYLLQSPLDEVAEWATDGRQVRDLLNYTLFYRAALKASDGGELRISIPSDVSTGAFNVEGGAASSDDEEPQPVPDGFVLLSLRIVYRLEKPRGGLLFAGGLPGDVAAHCYTDGQVHGARMWFPCFDDAPNKAYPIKMRVALPKGNIAVCSLPESLDAGRRVSDGKVHFVFRSTPKMDLPPRAVALAAGPFIRLVDPATESFQHFCLPAIDAEQRLSFSTQYVSRAAAVLGQLLETPLPWERYTQVFVSHPPQLVNPQPSMTIACASLLYDPSVLDQSFSIIRQQVHALVGQWFGPNALLRPEKWQDTWFLQGLCGHVTNLCMKKLHGNSAYMVHIHEENDAVCEADKPTSPPLYSEAPAHPFEHTQELRVRKATLVMRLIERRIGDTNFNKVLRQMLEKTKDKHSGAKHGGAEGVRGEVEAGGRGRVQFHPETMSTRRFFRTVRKCSGQDIEGPMWHWVYGRGCPKLEANFDLNRKHSKASIVFAMRLDCKGMLRRPQDAQQSQEQLTLRVHEIEATYDRSLKIADNYVMDEFPHQSRWRLKKSEREEERRGEDQALPAPRFAAECTQATNMSRNRGSGCLLLVGTESGPRNADATNAVSLMDDRCY